MLEGGGGGATSFLENSTRKQRQERGSRSRKLHPLSTRNTVAMATRRGVRRASGETVFVVPTPSGADGNKNTEARSSEIINKKNLTSDHLLGIVRLHIAVILADALRFPLLSRLLSVKWIRIVFKDDHLDLKKTRQMSLTIQLR